MNITFIKTPEDIAKAFEAMKELRPHLKDKASFVEQIQKQQNQAYFLGILEGDQTAACLGFRLMTTLAWGNIMYIDDLVTRAQSRGKGYAGELLMYAIAQAGAFGCDQIHLDTGYTRHDAHRVYLQHGFKMNSHHLSLDLKDKN
jgi:GNAT superfamily N-acetyltransferase